MVRYSVDPHGSKFDITRQQVLLTELFTDHIYSNHLLKEPIGPGKTTGLSIPSSFTLATPKK